MTDITVEKQAAILAADDVHRMRSKFYRLKAEHERLLIARVALTKNKGHIAEAYMADVQEAIERLLDEVDIEIEDTPYKRKLRAML